MADGSAKLMATDPEGWQKEFTLDKALVYAGSDPTADIHLVAPQVAPRHFQLLLAPTAPARLINLSTAPLTITRAVGAPANGADPTLAAGAAISVAPRQSTDLDEGDWIELAGYRLLFLGAASRSSNFQARVELADSSLRYDQPLEGALVISHTGSVAGVQFDVTLQGYDPQFCHVDPGPILFPGVERAVKFRLAHTQQSAPPAGDHTITFVITAPEDYPGEMVTVRRLIQIAPFRTYRVAVKPPQNG